MPVVRVRPTEYTVNCLPEEDLEGHIFAIAVAYRGRGLWAVLRHGRCLGAGGAWDHEMQPSSREDDWLTTHRFSLNEALTLAKAAAPNVTVNGFTVADALAMHQRRSATDGSAA
jgi:hypothetical protein